MVGLSLRVSTPGSGGTWFGASGVTSRGVATMISSCRSCWLLVDLNSAPMIGMSPSQGNLLSLTALLL